MIISLETLMKENSTNIPSVNDYINCFFKNMEKEIIYLAASSKIMPDYENALEAVKRLNTDKISVVDTYQLNTGITLINEVANNLLKKGLKRNDIIEILNDIKKRVITSFVIPNKKIYNAICTKSNLKINKSVFKRDNQFEITCENDGNLYSSYDFKAAADYFKIILNKYLENLENYDPNYIIIGNSRENKIKMSYMKDYIENYCYFDNIIIKNYQVSHYDDICSISLVKKK